MSEDTNALDDYFKSIDEAYIKLTKDFVQRIPKNKEGAQAVESRFTQPIIDILSDQHAITKSRVFRFFNLINEAVKIAEKGAEDEQSS